MKPIEIKSKQIETIRPGLDLSIFRKKPNVKTPSGILLHYARQFKEKQNFEYAMLLQELYKKVRDIEVSEKFRSKPLVEIEIVEGWKGIDNLDMFKGFESNFIIKSHQKDKDTNKVTTQTHEIKAGRVNMVFNLIKQQNVGEKIKYREFVPKLMKKYDLKISLNSFNGGKNRTWHYFPKYYYPIKILEALNFIHYSGRGDITRLK